MIEYRVMGVTAAVRLSRLALTDHGQHLASLHLFALLDLHLYHGAVHGRANRVLHLHGLNHQDSLAALYRAADRFFNAERVNGVLHLAGAALLWQCSQITDSPDRLFSWLLGYFLCYMPTLALVNSITFQNVANANDDFPKIRLWGTIGWIVAGLVVAE